MELITKRFGTIEVPEENAVEVPNGIPGFPRMKRVTLMDATAIGGDQPEGFDASLFWMQDLDDGDLAFLCVVPWAQFPEYDFDIDGDELGIEDEADVRVLNLITVGRATSAVRMTANLRAPLVVDVRTQRMHQVILTDSRWPVNAPLVAAHAAAAVLVPERVG